MAKRQDKIAKRIRELFEKANSATRQQWEYINQKGYDFSNDNQLTEDERAILEEQGMPTFTINRIIPVVEMLNYYATANNPRWQAIATEGSDTDVAAVFSDMADYIWNGSDGVSLFSNAINDAITKSCGYMVISVDPNKDNGMGEVVVTQPDPFDIYVDPKSRDVLFRDASFVTIRKILPRRHLQNLYPEYSRKIANANGEYNIDYSYTEKSLGDQQHDFDYKNIGESESADPTTGETDKLLELFETYEKVKVKYINVFYKKALDADQIQAIGAQVNEQIEAFKRQAQVEMTEQIVAMEEMVQKGTMLPARLKLETENLANQFKGQVESLQKEFTDQLQNEIQTIENTVITEKEFKIMQEVEDASRTIVDAVPFYGTRIKQTIVVGDKTLYEKILPGNISEYPLIPFHYKWTGTPYPMSAVSPLIGKQRELNKAHQLMVHNASLGSSLRWMYEEGSIDTGMWEKYSSSPGALLPLRPGAAPPTPVQPAPLSNAFFGIVNEGKQDMEYLAGIYAAMQGDTSKQHETFRGMLAMDEYGTRRIKQWMKACVEPGLKQMGKVIMQFSQSLYTAPKVFRIVQPNNAGDKEVEINKTLYNDLGEAVGKFNDYSAAKFDVKVVAGSTLPINRWAYLDELKELLKLGVVDDQAVLAETDVRNKAGISERKSMMSQLQSQVGQLEEAIKDKDGTIETLERQVVQAGIKAKILQAENEIDKKKNQIQTKKESESLKTQAQQKHLRDTMSYTAKKAEEDAMNKNKENQGE